jgi:cephalosporin-C deacetylase-like acetyl esterase
MVSKPVDPWRQIADWRRAISYLESLDAVDSRRIGGHAIILGATDRRLGCVVAQVPTISGYEAGPDVQSVGWSFCAPQPERSLGRAALS